MLHEFLFSHRDELIDRCKAKVALRSPAELNGDGMHYGIPLFLDQLVKTLEIEQTTSPLESLAVSGDAGDAGGSSQFSELGGAAVRHGRELSLSGASVEQVVHDYGDLCQAITDLAVDLDLEIDADEFRTLNRCLDNGIANAVAEFSHQRKLVHEERDEQAVNQRLGFLAHELRNHLNTATLAVKYLKSGAVGFNGSTAAILDRSLASLRNIVEHSLTDVRIGAGLPSHPKKVSVADFVARMAAAAVLEANSRGCELKVSTVDPELFVDIDQELLSSALGNLLQNAFKFTRPGTQVFLSAYAEGDRIRMDVQDHCGGLPPGNKEDLFLPFKQNSTDKTGLGLGLSICRRSVEANNGLLHVHDLPGSGCVFSIDLPKG